MLLKVLCFVPTHPFINICKVRPFLTFFCADLSIYQSIWHFEIIDLRKIHLLTDIIADMDWEELEPIACLKNRSRVGWGYHPSRGGAGIWHRPVTHLNNDHLNLQDHGGAIYGTLIHHISSDNSHCCWQTAPSPGS